MSLEMITWALRQDVKNSQFQVLIAIANEADSDGVCFTGQAKLAYKANVTDRTLRSCIAQFREMGLLHTERRTMTFGRGRKTDAIVLHPEVTGYEKAPYPHAEEDRKKAARNRKKYEVIPSYEPVDNFHDDQPEKFSGRKETPSQTQAEKFSGRTFNRKNHADQPENSGISTGKIQQSAFNRNARAFNPLKDPSVPQSVSNGTSVDNQTDRPTEEPAKKSSPAVTNQPPASSQTPGLSPRITHGVNHAKLRQDLHQTQLDTSTISDDVLSQIITIVFSRATQPVRSPQRFAYSCIVKEFHELISLAQSDQRQHSPTQRLTCPIHDLDYSPGGECRSCAADRKAAPPEEHWNPTGPQNLPSAPRFHRETQTA